jgi:hypothetical protein
MLKNCVFGTYRAPATMNASAEMPWRSPLTEGSARKSRPQTSRRAGRRLQLFWVFDRLPERLLKKARLILRLHRGLFQMFKVLLT